MIRYTAFLVMLCIELMKVTQFFVSLGYDGCFCIDMQNMRGDLFLSSSMQNDVTILRVIRFSVKRKENWFNN